jgi:hypothetical protein
VRRTERCIAECAKAPEQCTDIEIDALKLLATLQNEHEGDPDKALETLKLAHGRATKVGDAATVDDVQTRIDLLSRDKQLQRSHVPLATVLERITNARGQLDSLELQHGQIAGELSAARAEIAGVAEKRAAVAAETAVLNSQIADLTATRDELLARQQLFATALAAPLWIAAIRADIQAGRISELTLPLLERLRAVLPQHAQPLIVQIRARNGLAPEQPIDLTGLTGEERLFAAITNSLSLDPAADPTAFDSLLDAWDAFLSTPPGNSP